MGKIFGISDLPVSTIESALRPVTVPPPKITYKKITTVDRFVPTTQTGFPKAFMKMRNGIGKLMSHLSGAKPKSNDAGQLNN